MLLTGTFVRNLDEKQRISLPKSLRESLGYPANSVLYLAPGTDGSIALYPESVFAELASELGRNSPAGQDVRAFSRLFYSQAQRVEIDRQGRLRIPSELASFCPSDKEVVLIGVRDHLELWERKRWEGYLSEKQPRYDQIAESAFERPQSPPFAVSGPLGGSPPHIDHSQLSQSASAQAPLSHPPEHQAASSDPDGSRPANPR